MPPVALGSSAVSSHRAGLGALVVTKHSYSVVGHPARAAHPSGPGWGHWDDQALEQVVPAELVGLTSQEQFSCFLGDLSLDGGNARFIVRSRISQAPVTWRRTSTGTVTPSPTGGSMRSSRSGQDPVRKAEPLYRTRSRIPVRCELSVSTHPCVSPKWATRRGPRLIGPGRRVVDLT